MLSIRDIPKEQKQAEIEKWQSTNATNEDIKNTLMEEAFQEYQEIYLELKNAAAKEESEGLHFPNYQIIRDYLTAMNMTE